MQIMTDPPQVFATPYWHERLLADAAPSAAKVAGQDYFEQTWLDLITVIGDGMWAAKASLNAGCTDAASAWNTGSGEYAALYSGGCTRVVMQSSGLSDRAQVVVLAGLAFLAQVDLAVVGADLYSPRTAVNPRTGRAWQPGEAAQVGVLQDGPSEIVGSDLLICLSDGKSALKLVLPYLGVPGPLSLDPACRPRLLETSMHKLRQESPALFAATTGPRCEWSSPERDAKEDDAYTWGSTMALAQLLAKELTGRATLGFVLHAEDAAAVVAKSGELISNEAFVANAGRLTERLRRELR